MSNPLFQHDFGYQDSIFYDCVPTSQKYQQSKTNDAPHYLQLQKIVDDLHTAVQQFERLAFGPDCPKPMSILGKFSCLQSGCFFRCREYEDLLRHTDQGLHYKFKIDKFGDRDLSRTGDSYCLTVGAASTSGFELSGKKGAQKFDSLQINTQFSSAAVQNFFDCPKLPNDCNGVVLAVEGILDQFTNLPFTYADLERPSNRDARSRCPWCFGLSSIPHQGTHGPSETP
jgi:hypothetical protein